jgi:O-antigen ligase
VCDLTAIENSASSVKESNSSAFLFVALFLFFWITTNPFSLLVTATDGPLADSSNFINQIVTLALTGGLLIFAFNSPARAAIFRPRFLLAMIFVWYLFASMLSAHPDLAVKRVILAFLTCLNASIFLHLPRSDKHFATLLGIAMLFTLIVAYYGVFFIPRLGIHQASDAFEPMLAGYWRGHFAHKNVAAGIMVMAVFFGLFLYSSERRVLGTVIIILSVFFLSKTGGKTSTAALPAILVVAWVFENWKWTRIPIVIGGSLAINLFTIGSAVYEPIQSFLKDLGIDTTFTNRTDIWNFAFSAIAEKPFTGYGLQAFWQTSELIYSGGKMETWAVNATSAHNAYLDTLLSAGIPGLIMTVIWLIILPLYYVSKADTSGNNPHVTRLFIRLWLYGIITACVESMFFQSGSPLWFAFLFSIFGLQLQGQARLVST